MKTTAERSRSTSSRRAGGRHARRRRSDRRLSEDYEWQLRKHLLPFFATYAVADIDVALVERYREEKLIEREQVKAAAAAGQPLRDKRGQLRKPLSNGSINKTLVTLSQILDSAVERGLLAKQPRDRQEAPAEDLKADPPAARGGRAQGPAGGRRPRWTAPLPRYRIGRRPMIAVDGEVGTPRDGDVPAAVARRRRPPSTPRDRRSEDRRRQSGRSISASTSWRS